VNRPKGGGVGYGSTVLAEVNAESLYREIETLRRYPETRCHCERALFASEATSSQRLLRPFGPTQKLTVIASAPKGREAISVQVRDCFVGLLRRPPRNDNKVSGFTHIAARRYGVLAMTASEFLGLGISPPGGTPQTI
jgi:hypothetical protein